MQGKKEIRLEHEQLQAVSQLITGSVVPEWETCGKAFESACQNTAAGWKGDSGMAYQGVAAALLKEFILLTKELNSLGQMLKSADDQSQVLDEGIARKWRDTDGL